MFEVAEESMTSSNPAQEAGHLGEESEPWEEWTTALHTPGQSEEASGPEGAVS